MADNCGECLALDPKYKCGWCQSSNRCSIEKQCEDGGQGVWLKESDICPDPMILDFTPKYGPWEGGTNITITGVNLGRSVDDIYKNIMVAGIPCIPFKDSYIQTRQVW
jgi:plexin A